MKISLDLVVQIWSYCWLLFALTLIMQTPEVCPEYRSGVKTDPRSLISSHYQRAPAERDFAGSGFTYHSYPPLSLLLHKRRVPWDTASRNGCPLAEDGQEKFPCPRHHERHICVDDHQLCNGNTDCPSEEDENPTMCLFYSVIVSHLRLVADGRASK